MTTLQKATAAISARDINKPPAEPESFTEKHDEALWAYRMGNISIDEYYAQADALLDNEGKVK